MILFKLAFDFYIFDSNRCFIKVYIPAMFLKYSPVLVAGPDVCNFLVILHLLRKHSEVINSELIRVMKKCEKMQYIVKYH